MGCDSPQRVTTDHDDQHIHPMRGSALVCSLIVVPRPTNSANAMGCFSNAHQDSVGAMADLHHSLGVNCRQRGRHHRSPNDVDGEVA